MIKKTSVLSLLLLIATLMGCQSTESKSDNDKNALDVDLIVKQLEQKRQHYQVPGLAIGIIQNGEVILSKGLGHSDVVNKQAVDASTLFAIGSTTKAFTSTAIAMSVDKGELQWDTPASAYLPEFSATTTKNLTIKNLLAHNTGFSRFDLRYANPNVSREDVLSGVSSATPIAKAGQQFTYNNLMYLAAGQVNAAVTKDSWDSLIDKRLLTPLNMKSTTTNFTQATSNSNMATGYHWQESSKAYQVTPHKNISNIAPAGGLYSNIHDLLHWLEFQLTKGKFGSKQLINQEILAQTHTSQTPMNSKMQYGLGWVVTSFQGEKMLMHDGSTQGFSSIVAFLPEKELGFVLLANVTATPLLTEAIDIVFEQLSQAAGNKVGDAQQLLSYQGKYYAKFKNSNFSFSVQNGVPYLDIPSEQLYQLNLPNSRGRLSFKNNRRVSISFIKNDKGEAIALKLHTLDATLTLPRVIDTQAKNIEESELNALIGTYPSALFNGDLKVIKKNGGLALDVPNKSVIALLPPDESDHWRFSIRPSMSVAFERNATGEAIALSIFKQGKLLGRAEKKLNIVANKQPSIESLLDQIPSNTLSETQSVTLIGSISFPSMAVQGKAKRILIGGDQVTQSFDLGTYGVFSEVLDTNGYAEKYSFAPKVQHVGTVLNQRRLLASLQSGDWKKYKDNISLVKAVQKDSHTNYVLQISVNQLPSVTFQINGKTGDILHEQYQLIGANGNKMSLSIEHSNFQQTQNIRYPQQTIIKGGPNGEVKLSWNNLVKTNLTNKK